MTAHDVPRDLRSVSDDELPDPMTTGQAAEVIGVGVRTVIRWFDERRHGLDGRRLGTGPRKLTRASVLVVRDRYQGRTSPENHSV